MGGWVGGRGWVGFVGEGGLGGEGWGERGSLGES